jgi:hypothetical protein
MAGGFDFGEDASKPLLPAKDQREKGPTPLPKLQLGILMFFQLAEPITSQCIYPFINQVSYILILALPFTQIFVAYK